MCPVTRASRIGLTPRKIPADGLTIEKGKFDVSNPTTWCFDIHSISVIRTTAGNAGADTGDTYAWTVAAWRVLREGPFTGRPTLPVGGTTMPSIVRRVVRIVSYYSIVYGTTRGIPPPPPPTPLSSPAKKKESGVAGMT